MKNSIKRITCGLLLVIAVACLSIFAFACKKGGGDENKNAFIVSVFYPDGTPVNGKTDGTAGVKANGDQDTLVRVQFCEVDENKEELHCEDLITLGEDGTVSVTNLPSIEAGHSWHVKLNGLPVGYTLAEDYYIAAPGTLTITLADDTTEYTVSATDGNGNPVADVWFQIGYNDASSSFVSITSQRNVVGVAKSDEQGKATFKIVPEASVNYLVRIADPSVVDSSYEKPVPYGYINVDYSVQYENGETSVDFEFNYLPNSVYYNKRTELNYKRVYDEVEGAKEITGSNIFNLEKDRHFYFYLLTYLEAGGSSAQQIDTNQKNNTLAAAGVYEVTFTTTSSANIVMYNYAGTSAFVSTNADGIPAIINAQTDSANHTITLTLTVDSSNSRSMNYFGIYADADCEVEITVTRTGDAEEPDAVVDVDAPFTTPTAKYADNASGTLALMPVDGTLNAVYNEEDKYWHVDSVDGPLLLVNLTQVITRVGESAIKDIPTAASNLRGESIFVILSGNTRTNYNKLVKAYSEYVNSDGVYPVNDDLYSFLSAINGIFTTAVTGDDAQYNWLIPCQYYEPADGFNVSGSGTESDPYNLVLGLSKLNNTESNVYITYKVPASGAYTITASSGTLSGLSTVSGTNYYALIEGDEVKLLLSGAAANATVTLEAAKLARIFAYEYDVENALNKGSTEDTALSFFQAGLYAFIVNDTVTSEAGGIYVVINNMLTSGTYTITAYGGSSITYNGDKKTTVTITAEQSQPYVLFLSADADGLYLVNVEFAA